MPTPQISVQRRDENRREEWEDREYWAETQHTTRDHELNVLDRKNAAAERQTELKVKATAQVKLGVAKANDRRNRVIVRCITLLALFGRPIPRVLEQLLVE